MPRNFKVIGQAIRAKRNRAHITQKELAEATGLADTTISYIESGRPCSENSLKLIFAALEILTDMKKQEQN